VALTSAITKRQKLQTKETKMGQFFSNLEAARVWLHVNGWIKQDNGAWFKGGKRADIRKSPAKKDEVVSVVICKT
jgi:hypothetical protein